jgi:hypothetical protein
LSTATENLGISLWFSLTESRDAGSVGERGLGLLPNRQMIPCPARASHPWIGSAQGIVRMSTSLPKRQSQLSAQRARRLNKERGQKQLHAARPLIAGTIFNCGFDAFLAGMLHDIPETAPTVTVIEHVDPDDPSQVITQARNVMAWNHAEFLSSDPERKLRACERTVDILCLKLIEATEELHATGRTQKLQVDDDHEVGAKNVDPHLLRAAMFTRGIIQDMLAGRRNSMTFFVERQIAKEGGRGLNFFQAEARNHLGLAAEFQLLFQKQYRRREDQSITKACDIVLETITERLHKIGGSIDYILDAKAGRRNAALRELRIAATKDERNRPLLDAVEAINDSASHLSMIDNLISMVIEETQVDLIDVAKLPARAIRRDDQARTRDDDGRYAEEPTDRAL